MTQYIQDNLVGMDAELAKAEQKNIDEETRQMHLAREFCRWGKYAKFSKDPEFKRRYVARQMKIADLMARGVTRT